MPKTIRTRCAKDGMVYSLAFEGNLNKLRVSQLKTYLRSLTGIDTVRQVLEFDGLVLQDSMSCYEAGVSVDAVLDLAEQSEDHEDVYSEVNSKTEGSEHNASSKASSQRLSSSGWCCAPDRRTPSSSIDYDEGYGGDDIATSVYESVASPATAPAAAPPLPPAARLPPPVPRPEARAVAPHHHHHHHHHHPSAPCDAPAQAAAAPPQPLSAVMAIPIPPRPVTPPVGVGGVAVGHHHHHQQQQPQQQQQHHQPQQLPPQGDGIPFAAPGGMGQQSDAGGLRGHLQPPAPRQGEAGFLGAAVPRQQQQQQQHQQHAAPIFDTGDRGGRAPPPAPAPHPPQGGRLQAHPSAFAPPFQPPQPQLGRWAASAVPTQRELSYGLSSSTLSDLSDAATSAQGTGPRAPGFAVGGQGPPRNAPTPHPPLPPAGRQRVMALEVPTRQPQSMLLQQRVGPHVKTAAPPPPPPGVYPPLPHGGSPAGGASRVPGGLLDLGALRGSGLPSVGALPRGAAAAPGSLDGSSHSGHDVSGGMGVVEFDDVCDDAVIDCIEELPVGGGGVAGRARGGEDDDDGDEPEFVEVRQIAPQAPAGGRWGSRTPPAGCMGSFGDHTGSSGSQQHLRDPSSFLVSPRSEARGVRHMVATQMRTDTDDLHWQAEGHKFHTQRQLNSLQLERAEHELALKNTMLQRMGREVEMELAYLRQKSTVVSDMTLSPKAR